MEQEQNQPDSCSFLTRAVMLFVAVTTGTSWRLIWPQP